MAIYHRGNLCQIPAEGTELWKLLKFLPKELNLECIPGTSDCMHMPCSGEAYKQLQVKAGTFTAAFLVFAPIHSSGLKVI